MSGDPLNWTTRPAVGRNVNIIGDGRIKTRLQDSLSCTVIVLQLAAVKQISGLPALPTHTSKRCSTSRLYHSTVYTYLFAY